jgi:predicted nucleic acid-binding protein
MVLDVCGAIEILLQKEKADKFYKVLNESSLVLAPDLYISELTNALWKYYSSRILTKDECVQYIRDGLDYVDYFTDSGEIWEEAFAEGVQNAHSIYDMFYLVATRRNSGTLITNDSTLAAICKKNHVQVCC